MQSAPLRQEEREFSSLRVKRWIKQPVVRRKNDEERKGHDRPEKESGDDDGRIGLLPAAEYGAYAPEDRQRRLHRRAAPVAWREFAQGELRAATKTGWMLDGGHVDSGTGEETGGDGSHRDYHHREHYC